MLGIHVLFGFMRERAFPRKYSNRHEIPKMDPSLLRKHDLRRPKIHPVSVFFFFFEVSPADVNLVPKHSSVHGSVPGSADGSVHGHVPGHVHGCVHGSVGDSVPGSVPGRVHRIDKIGEPSF